MIKILNIIEICCASQCITPIMATWKEPDASPPNVNSFIV